MKQKLSEEEKTEQKELNSWWNKFLYSMKIKGALKSYTANDFSNNKTTDHQLPAAGTN